MKQVVRNVILFIAVLLVINRVISVLFVSIPTTLGVITSESMKPTLNKGDVIIWYPVHLDHIKVGDVIVYQSYAFPDKTVTHRVVRITKTGDEPRFITKGDANPYIDQKGPHIPERPIGKDNLRGKVLTVGDAPLRIPFIGDIWFFLIGYMGGVPSAFPWISFLAIGLFLFITGLYLYQRAKQEKTYKLGDLIFGPEIVGVKRLVLYALVIYILILVLSSLTFYDIATASLGVNEKPPEGAMLYFDEMKPGEQKYTNLTITAPGTPIPHKVIAFSEGPISEYIALREPIHTLGPNELRISKVDAHVPVDALDGVYQGRIYVYSSPYWHLLPNSFIEEQLESNPRQAIIYFDLLSAFLLMVISIGLLVGASKAIDVYIISSTSFSWSMDMYVYRRPDAFFLPTRKLSENIKRFVHKMQAWILDIDWIDFEPGRAVLAAFIAIMFLPIVFMGYYFIGMLLAAFAAGLLAYILGCRWRAQVMLAGMLSTAIILGAVALGAIWSFPKNISTELYLGLLTNVGAPSMIVFLIMLIPSSFMSYIAAWLAQRGMEHVDPLFRIIRSDL